MPTLSPADDYESIAPFYDRYTAHPDFERWILSIEALARDHGFSGGPALDAACGTGSSLLPLARLGYAVSGFDISEAMLREARRKLGPAVALQCLDVTSAPVVGQYALITWLNDACNCLLDEEALRAALRSLAANLAPEGVLIFDANTLVTFNGAFAGTHTRRQGGLEFRWEGLTAAVDSAGTGSARLSVFAEGEGDSEALVVSEHTQRHHPHRLICAALREAGLVLRNCLGQEPSGELTPKPESGQPKRLYVAAKSWSANKERRNDAQGQAPAEAGAARAGDNQARLEGRGARSNRPSGAAACRS